jgi:hypothetical protein
VIERPRLTDFTVERSTQSRAQFGGWTQALGVRVSRRGFERESADKRHNEDIGKSHEELLVAPR